MLAWRKGKSVPVFLRSSSQEGLDPVGPPFALGDVVTASGSTSLQFTVESLYDPALAYLLRYGSRCQIPVCNVCITARVKMEKP
jgi:hypothetical protein